MRKFLSTINHMLITLMWGVEKRLMDRTALRDGWGCGEERGNARGGAESERGTEGNMKFNLAHETKDMDHCARFMKT